MARIVITRPNGETEYAELTTDKAQAGDDRLAVEKAGTVYYAKLDKGISTHMYVIKPDGRKLYVQKEVKFTWKYTVGGNDDNALKMVIPRTGKYKLTITDATYDKEYKIIEEKIKIEYDIFEQGAKFIKRKPGRINNTNLESRTGKSYSCAFWSDIDTIRCVYINKIEYIDEA